MNLSNIIRSWLISVNPTEEEKTEAHRRLKICRECPFGDFKGIPTCKDCGCPIKRKMFSTIPCRKWLK